MNARPDELLSSRSTADRAEPRLQVIGLLKTFGDADVVDRVDFDVRPGEVHALLGQNGAGKSTLIKMLAGVYVPDAGEIRFDGRPVQPSTEKLPISFIHQDLGLIPTMTVAENIALIAGYPRPRGLISWSGARAKARRVLDIMGSEIDPDTMAVDLTAAERSLVAIARAMAIECSLLVLDEPTASLSSADVEHLFAVLKHLRERGVGMTYVTHRLDEVFRIADRVTVLRDGRKISTLPVSATTSSELVRMIVGRTLAEEYVRAQPPRDQPLLQLSDVSVGDVGPVSLEVGSGEVVGLVGLRGAGQNAIGRAVFGDVQPACGSMRLAGRELRPRSPREAVAAGVAFVSSKRAEEALAYSLTVQENAFLNPAAGGRAVLRPMARRTERFRARTLLEHFTVRPADPERLIETMSGGNQQKVVLARWLELGSRLLVLEEPTTGVDVGARAEIYEILKRVVEAGSAALVISSDFSEVAGVCHRALVFNRGRVVAELDQSRLTTAYLTELASGEMHGGAA